MNRYPTLALLAAALAPLVLVVVLFLGIESLAAKQSNGVVGASTEIQTV
jgi:hypothetical protein